MVLKYHFAFTSLRFEGLVVSGRIGTGLLVARLEDRWSAPCAIGTVGMGYGMLAGCDINHYLVVLTTHQAVEALLHGTVQLGTEVGIAVGPVGALLLSDLNCKKLFSSGAVVLLTFYALLTYYDKCQNFR